MPGLLGAYDWAGTLALAERLQPNAKTLVLVSGAAEIDMAWQRDAIAQLQPSLKNYDVRYLVTFRKAEVLKQLSQLPRDSIVMLMPIFGIDGTRMASPSGRATEFVNASSAPAYSPVATLLGDGIVGGHMDSYIGQGTAVADLALEVLPAKILRTSAQNKLQLQTRVDAGQLGAGDSGVPSARNDS
jgi:hypothetical protein